MGEDAVHVVQPVHWAERGHVLRKLRIIVGGQLFTLPDEVQRIPRVGEYGGEETAETEDPHEELVFAVDM